MLKSSDFGHFWYLSIWNSDDYFPIKNLQEKKTVIEELGELKDFLCVLICLVNLKFLK